MWYVAKVIVLLSSSIICTHECQCEKFYYGHIKQMQLNSLISESNKRKLAYCICCKSFNNGASINACTQTILTLLHDKH